MIKRKITAREMSLAHKKYIKTLRRDKFIVHVSQVMLLIIFLCLWELFAHFEIVDPFFISSPSRIWKTLVDLFATGEIWKHMGITLAETVLGFVIATLIGTLIAVLLWWSERLRKILDPYIVVLNSLPKIALGPIIIIWVGAGMGAVLTMCVLICVIITTISMLNAFLSAEPDKILLMKSMGANKFQIFCKLVLPNSIPDFISVLKINVGMAWVGTIMGEYLVSKAGLGYLIVYGGQVFKLDLVMTSTVILCTLATLMYVVINKIEKRVKRS